MPNPAHPKTAVQVPPWGLAPGTRQDGHQSNGTLGAPQTSEAHPQRRERIKPEPSLKSRALRLLAGREYSRVELERKLGEHEKEPGELAAALDALAAKGFINEARVMESLLHRRSAKLGNARVMAELRAKGVVAEHMEAAAQQLNGTELERARTVWAKKFSAPATTQTDRAKQARFLAARGFSSATISRLLRFDAE